MSSAIVAGVPRRAAIGGRALAPVAARPLLVVVVLKCALGIGFAGRYGWQRDELYYAVAGRHLQGGYVEFPPVTALLSAAARLLFGWSLVGFRAFPILAGAVTTIVAALVARELGGGTRAQVIAAATVAFSPLLLATNGLFQPVSFDQAATMVFLWLVLRLALGRGSWLAIGAAVGVGLETKYTLAVPLVLLVGAFLVWRRDALEARGVAAAAVVAAALMVPNLIWEAAHGWVSVHWFLNPPSSATDESRPQYLLDLVLQTNAVAVPVAVAGIVSLWRSRAVRPLAAATVGVAVAYFALGGKSYYAMPVVFFLLAAGAVELDRRATRRRLVAYAVPYAAFFLVALPQVLPVLPLHTAISRGVVKSRSDYQDELGWPDLAAQVARLSGRAAVVLTRNYGEAGALELFGRGLPPVASADVTFRYWRPSVSGRRALLVGFGNVEASGFCRGYQVAGRIRMPTDNEERGLPIARCVLDSTLARSWPRIVHATGW
ncbi:MAG TPA: glycosyltransferase family 39 protein [Gaiellaceae bacterium]